ncbi:hypothetical protein [Winogradskyella tangerina]|uniref:hypothetical protein n=1 Tax=Winogradskyella tangerina TaxID=2023240 RepID=UPI000DBE7DEF|nr:hypothetical protein [Winogradskyella tangerina]
MKVIKILLIFILPFTFTNDNAKAYYFPIENFREGIIYKYECLNDPVETQYWKLTSEFQNLITEAYNQKYEKFEFFKEKFTDEGSEVVKFITYANENKSLVVFNRKIKSSDVFKWSTNEEYGYSAEFIHDSYGDVFFSVSKSFVEKETIKVLGIDRETLKFKCLYKTKIPSTNYDYSYIQYMYYAQNLGLVKIEKEYPSGKKLP